MLCQIHSLVQGYPSVGDVQSTVTVPREKWFEYGGERSGRFQVTSAASCIRNHKLVVTCNSSTRE